MPSHPSKPPADPLEQNPFITRRDLDDVKDVIRSLAVTIQRQTERGERHSERMDFCTESTNRLSNSVDRLTTVADKLTVAIERLESTVREVTTVTQDPTGPVAVESERSDLDDAKNSSSNGVPAVATMERRRKTRQTG
jgi:hypothetical protein